TSAGGTKMLASCATELIKIPSSLESHHYNNTRYAWDGARAGRSAQGIDIGNEVIGCLVIGQNCGHRRHLRTVHVFWMRAANALSEIFQLSDQIPVTHPRQPGGIRRLHAPPISTVTGPAGHISPLTA